MQLYKKEKISIFKNRFIFRLIRFTKSNVIRKIERNNIIKYNYITRWQPLLTHTFEK